MTTPTHIFSRCIFVYMVIIVIFNHIDILLCCLFTYTIAETCVFCRYRARVCIAILNVIKERVKCWVRIDRRDWPVTENETVVVDSPPSMPKHDHAWRIKNPITLTSQWARWRLKSPAYGLFTQLFIQVQIKEDITAPRHWPLCGEFIGDRWILRTKGQQRGKCFHLMTSSWLQGPILSTWLSLNPPYKVWDGITYPFTNPIGCTVEVCWSLWMDK